MPRKSSGPKPPKNPRTMNRHEWQRRQNLGLPILSRRQFEERMAVEKRRKEAIAKAKRRGDDEEPKRLHSMRNLPRTCHEAEELRKLHYYNAKPCPRGHLSKRYAYNKDVYERRSRRGKQWIDERYRRKSFEPLNKAFTQHKHRCMACHREDLTGAWKERKNKDGFDLEAYLRALPPNKIRLSDDAWDTIWGGPKGAQSDLEYTVRKVRRRVWMERAITDPLMGLIGVDSTFDMEAAERAACEHFGITFEKFKEDEAVYEGTLEPGKAWEREYANMSEEEKDELEELGDRVRAELGISDDDYLEAPPGWDGGRLTFNKIESSDEKLLTAEDIEGGYPL